MPVYEYSCKECGKRFEQAMTVHDCKEGKKPACPKCKSRQVEKLLSRFMPMTAQKT